jgi:hypothetical protein
MQQDLLAAKVHGFVLKYALFVKPSILVLEKIYLRRISLLSSQEEFLFNE